jgi:hypothetical protein
VNVNKADKSAADAMRLAENTRRMSAIARQNRRQNVRLDETSPKLPAGRAAEPAGQKRTGFATEIPLTGEERTAIE